MNSLPTAKYKRISNDVKKKKYFKGALSGLRCQNGNGMMKMMKNALYFTLKALFVLKIFKFPCRFIGHVSKWLD